MSDLTLFGLAAALAVVGALLIAIWCCFWLVFLRELREASILTRRIVDATDALYFSLRQILPADLMRLGFSAPTVALIHGLPLSQVAEIRLRLR